MENFPTIVVFVIVVLCALSDINSNRIPNIITLPGMLIAIAYYSLTRGFEGFCFGLFGAAIGMALLILPYGLGGMGAGDVKLMGAVGSFLGVKATIEAFLLIAIAGGIYSLMLILIRRDVYNGFFREKLIVLSSMVMLRQYIPFETGSCGQKPRLKYGVAIAFGTISYLFLKSIGIKFYA